MFQYHHNLRKGLDEYCNCTLYLKLKNLVCVQGNYKALKLKTVSAEDPRFCLNVYVQRIDYYVLMGLRGC